MNTTAQLNRRSDVSAESLGTPTYIRLTPTHDAAIDKVLDMLRVKHAGMTVCRADAIRHLITVGAIAMGKRKASR